MVFQTLANSNACTNYDNHPVLGVFMYTTEHKQNYKQRNCMNNLCIPHRKTCNSKYTHKTILKHNILYPYLSIKSFARSLSDRAPTSVFYEFQRPYSDNRYTLVYFITLCFFLETSLRTERLRLGFPLRFSFILLPNFRSQHALSFTLPV